MNNPNIQILIEAKNKTEGEIKAVQTSLNNFKKNTENFKSSFQKMALVGTGAITALTLSIRGMVKEANEAELVQSRMNHILKTVGKTTDEQIDSLNKQAEALERVGVVSADVIRQGIGQLASFDLQGDSIQKLIPSILDYTVAEKGLNMTKEDLQATTNGLAQALQGNFGALTRTGFVLDDATKALIENGTEAERVEALVKVLNSTYLGMNESMAQTAEGGLLKLRFAFERLKESIGNVFKGVGADFIPKVTQIIDKITLWIEKNPELVLQITKMTAIFLGLVTAIGGLGFILPAIVSGFTFLLSPVGLVTVGILAVAGAIAWLHNKGEEINAWLDRFNEKTGLITYFQTVWQYLVETFNTIVIPAWERLKESMAPLQPYLEILAKILGGALLVALYAVVTAFGVIATIVSRVIAVVMELISLFSNAFVVMFDKVKEKLNWIADTFTKIWNTVSRIVNSGIGGIFGGGGGGGKKSKSVNDAIISPNGDVITTHPNDWLIATQDPKNLGRGGGAGGLNIVINNPMLLDNAMIQALSRKLGETLRQELRI